MIVTDEQIKHMVDRFLGWRLPENFNPDGGISFKAIYNENSPFGPMKSEPTGTNLFDAEQATVMVRHMLEGLPEAALSTPAEADVAVKPLEWRARDDIPGLHDALGMDGWYRNIRESDGLFEYEGDPAATDYRVRQFYSTLEAAKAAAQADYEKRIRSALVISSKPQSAPAEAGEAEVVAWRYRSTAPGGKHDWSLTRYPQDVKTLEAMRMEVEPLVPLSALTACRDRLAEVGWERDAFRDSLVKTCGKLIVTKDAADAEVSRLKALVEEAREGMRPFAQQADVYNDIPGIIRTDDNVELWQPGGHRRTTLTIGDLRRARALLSRMGGEAK